MNQKNFMLTSFTKTKNRSLLDLKENNQLLWLEKETRSFFVH